MKQRRTGASRTKPVSIRDVAREAGVSTAAASYALNGKRGLAEDTRQRVLAAAEKLQYHPNKSAQRMRTGRSDTIGLVLPDIGNPFFPRFARAVQQAAGEAGKSVLLVDTGNDPAADLEGVRKLSRHGVDGIIWWPTVADALDMALADCPPLVLVDRTADGIDSVTSDHRTGGRLMAEQVAATGCRRIGLIRGPANFTTAALRRDGFVAALDEPGRIVWEFENAFAPPLLEPLRKLLLSGAADVIVCPNDLIAIEVIRLLRAVGVEVPAKVSVTGFGDILFSDMISPPLTTIHQPVFELGLAAVELLLRRIDDPEAPAERRILPVRLILRESLAPPTN